MNFEPFHAVVHCPLGDHEPHTRGSGAPWRHQGDLSSPQTTALNLSVYALSSSLSDVQEEFEALGGIESGSEIEFGLEEEGRKAKDLPLEEVGEYLKSLLNTIVFIDDIHCVYVPPRCTYVVCVAIDQGLHP